MPHIRGVLDGRAEVVAEARNVLVETGVANRCDVVPPTSLTQWCPAETRTGWRDPSRRARREMRGDAAEVCCCPKSKWGLDQAVVAFVIADDPRLTQNQAISATVITDDSEFTQNLAVSALVIADGFGLAQNLAVSAIVIADGSGLAQNLVVSAIVIADDPRLTPESDRIGDCDRRRPQVGPPFGCLEDRMAD